MEGAVVFSFRSRGEGNGPERFFFFVEKKDKSLRACIEYCGLNDMKNHYPWPLDFSREPRYSANSTTRLTNAPAIFQTL